MTNLQTALDYAKQNRERFLNDLNEVLKIPSISTDAEYKGETRRTAEWMAEYLRKLGMDWTRKNRLRNRICRDPKCAKRCANSR